MDSLPTDSASGSNEANEIEKVAEATLADSSPPELEPFYISFSNYIQNKCCVDGMSGPNAQVAIKIVKSVGVDFKGKGNFASNLSRLEVKPVGNVSPYEDYYKDLPNEICDGQEVKEIKYIHENKEVDLRIFFYSLSNIFYMLAITADKHENLDHSPYRESKRRGR